jgi:hypothetical protein
MTARIGLVAATLLLAGALVFALSPTARRGGFTHVLSTRRADALGAKALYRVLELAGLAPVRWTEDLESLDVRGVLVILNPETPRPLLQGMPRLPTFGKFERREVLRWVEAGNRLVLVSSRTTGLHRDFGVRVLDEERPRRTGRRHAIREARVSAGPGTAVSTGRSPLSGAARRLASPRLYHLDVSATDPRAVFGHADQAVVAAVPRGAGLAVFVSTPYLASNVGLREADNLRFFYDLVGTLSGEGRVLFDEYHHGERKRRGFVALASSYNLHFAAFQAVLAALLAAWAARRLPRRRRAEARSRGAEEHLAAMATLYERGGVGSYAVQQLWGAALGALAARLGLRGERAPAAVAAALRARGRADLAARLEALDRRRAALGDRVRERDLVAFARDLTRLRLDVEARRTETRP